MRSKSATDLVRSEAVNRCLAHMNATGLAFVAVRPWLLGMHKHGLRSWREFVERGAHAKLALFLFAYSGTGSVLELVMYNLCISSV